MPLYTFIDDVIFDGEESVFDKLVFYATFYASYVLDIETEVRTNPPHFYPNSQDPEIIRSFNECYRIVFDKLVTYLPPGPLTPLE